MSACWSSTSSQNKLFPHRAHSHLRNDISLRPPRTVLSPRPVYASSHSPYRPTANANTTPHVSILHTHVPLQHACIPALTFANKLSSFRSHTSFQPDIHLACIPIQPHITPPSIAPEYRRTVHAREAPGIYFLCLVPLLNALCSISKWTRMGTKHTYTHHVHVLL